jgi:hypothetical protein
MSDRQATMIVADDWVTTISGKVNISGIYGTDISIPVDPFTASQLVFAFIIETSPEDPYQSLEIRVTLPGGDTRNLHLPISRFKDGEADKIRWCLKYPLLFANPILRPGPIEAKVIHEKGGIKVAAPVVILTRPHSVPAQS